jgi:molecular chaperone DnaK
MNQKVHKMNDQSQAKALIDSGKLAIENDNWERLREIDNSLLGLLPKSAQQEVNTKIGF